MKTERIAFPLVALVLILLTIGMISIGHSPAFYDIFGLVVFTFLTSVGIYMINKPKDPPQIIWFILIIIGLLGLFVDGSIVIGEFLKWA
jgi:multidrug transporter EmrE-like cation transporter